MWGVLPNFLRQLDHRAGADLDGDRSLIEEFLPRPRLAWVWREDVVAQAVSWAKAGPDRLLAPLGLVKGNPSFSFDQIGGMVREIGDHNAAWRSWFAANQIDPLEVRFEDLIADQGG